MFNINVRILLNKRSECPYHDYYDFPLFVIIKIIIIIRMLPRAFSFESEILNARFIYLYKAGFHVLG